MRFVLGADDSAMLISYTKTSLLMIYINLIIYFCTLFLSYLNNLNDLD